MAKLSNGNQIFNFLLYKPIERIIEKKTKKRKMSQIEDNSNLDIANLDNSNLGNIENLNSDEDLSHGLDIIEGLQSLTSEINNLLMFDCEIVPNHQILQRALIDIDVTLNHLQKWIHETKFEANNLAIAKGIADGTVKIWNLDAKVKSNYFKWMNDKFPKCIDCKNFHGYINGKCSMCSQSTVPSRIMANEDLKTWVETGVHSKIQDECCICFQENELINNFACLCRPNTCQSCNSRIKICPTCRAGKYLRITKSEIRALLLTKANKQAKRHIVARAASLDFPSPFNFKQLICLASDIDEVISELTNAGIDHYSNYNSIFCLSVDWRNSKGPYRSYVTCYKGFDDFSITYRNIIKHRCWTDEWRIMDTFAMF